MKNDIKFPNSEYPFTPQKFEVDGLTYSYVDTGAEGNAPSDFRAAAMERVLVCVHGNPSWSFLYRKIIKELGTNYRVIAVDHIGCGLSDKPSSYSYRLEKHSSNLGALLKHLELERYCLMLHDWGGPIGLRAVAPVIQQVNGLIVLNTTGNWLPYLPWYIRLCRIPKIGEFLVRRLNLFCLAAAKVGSVSRLSSEVREGFLFPYSNYANRIAIHRFVRDIPLETKHPSRQTLASIQSSISYLAEHNVPTRILWGEQDPVFTQKYLDEWLKQLPQANCTKFPDAGHFVIEDAEEEVVKACSRFLEQIYGPTPSAK